MMVDPGYPTPEAETAACIARYRQCGHKNLDSNDIPHHTRCGGFETVTLHCLFLCALVRPDHAV